MNLEIVGFYPQAKQEKPTKLIGTMHIYLVDFDMDLRGILVFKMKKGFFFKIPGRPAIDAETQEKVYYPFISFSNPDNHKDLIDTVILKGTEFMEKEEGERKRKKRIDKGS